ncbi:MAG: class I SAM-dependent methyltransferase [Pseudomonadales bacterium]
MPETWIRKLMRKRREKRLFAAVDDRAIFDWIYRTNKWGDPESVSGKGSNLAQTRNLRAELPALLQRLEVKTLLDAPCGDFHWMQHTPLAVDEYIGADIVPALVDANQTAHAAPGRRFVCLDLATDPLPAVDAILCRDCLVHLDLTTMARVIDNIRASGSTYLLTTSHRRQQGYVDKLTGKHRRVNLEGPPFGWPPPISAIVENLPPSGKDSGKILGVWRIDGIRAPG